MSAIRDRTFSLATGENLNSDLLAITIYLTKVEDECLLMSFAD
ncbi:MAG: hypothetical protein AAGI23_20660 [Bacteroidota bacterium]